VAKRIVYFYPDWDILQRHDVPRHAKGSRILIQKASEQLPSLYPNYIRKYVDAMAEECWLITDDLAYGQYCNLENALPEYLEVKRIHTLTHLIPEMTALRNEMKTKMKDVNTYARHGYGWDLYVRRIKRKPVNKIVAVRA